MASAQPGRCCGGCARQLTDGRKHYPPTPKQDADIFEVLIRQMREYRNINLVFSKTLRVLGHTELFEPVRNCCIAAPLRVVATALMDKTTGKSAVATHQPKVIRSCGAFNSHIDFAVEPARLTAGQCDGNQLRAWP